MILMFCSLSFGAKFKASSFINLAPCEPPKKITFFNSLRILALSKNLSATG